MESLDYWRLCDELSIVQAALLVADCDPSASDSYAEDLKRKERPKGYEAAKTAISNALERGSISGRHIPYFYCDAFGKHTNPIENSVDIYESRVEVDSLRKWLESRGFRTGFFFPKANDAPDYLDPTNLRYAPKLAAAVNAWQSVTDAGGKSPKQALMKWLREHAAEFGMTDDEGKPNESGIEEAAKVANWQLTGGAPKTPGE